MTVACVQETVPPVVAMKSLAHALTVKVDGTVANVYRRVLSTVIRLAVIDGLAIAIRVLKNVQGRNVIA